MKVSLWRFFLVMFTSLTFVAYAPRSFAEATMVTTTGTDKYVHAAAAFSLSTASYITMKRAKYTKWEGLISAFAFTTAVGVGKEIADPEFSTDDIAADLLGAGASFVLCFTFDW